MWPLNLQDAVDVISVKHDYPNKGFSLVGALDFQVVYQGVKRF